MPNDMVDGIEVLFVAGFGPVVTNQEKSVRLFQDILRLPLVSIKGYDGYLYSADIPGVKHFALWPLDKAALSCFGKSEWPEDLPVPQAWLEIDVADIESATKILEAHGYDLLTCLRKEPWGQIVTRFLSPEGILLAVTHTPFLREEGTE